MREKGCSERRPNGGAARWLLAAVACLFGCGGVEPSLSDEESSELKTKGRIQILVTVDWEGRDLAESNLRAMHEFRAEFPRVRMVQFLNAAYFTKPGADANEVTSKIRTALLPTDELGLHVHGWKRLFEAAGVKFRTSPSFWGASYPLQGDCNYDCGHEISISGYTESELEKVVRFSIDTLERNGFGRAKSFRAGGWMATEPVRQAIVASGIVWDSSAVPRDFLAGELQGLPLLDMVTANWKGITDTSQPYAIGALGELPDNGALADYVTADEMVKVFEDNEALLQKDPTVTRTVVIGFHEETAAKYLYRVKDALVRIMDLAAKDKVPISFVTTRSVAKPKQ
jgi:hypothetical protein